MHLKATWKYELEEIDEIFAEPLEINESSFIQLNSKQKARNTEQDFSAQALFENFGVTFRRHNRRDKNRKC